MQLNDTLSLISSGLLIIALPIVIVAAIQHIRVMGGQIRSKFNVEQQQTIDRIVGIAVKAAEQAGGIKGLISEQKQKEAIGIAEKFLAEHGIKMDVGKLVDLVEAEVQTQFTNPTPIADTAQARQALVDSAVQSAVLAAEQSGLTGLIQNLGPEKKAYALQMAGQYLGQYGMKLDPSLLGGLIEGQVARLTQQAQVMAAPYLPVAAPQVAALQAAPTPAYSPTTGLQPGG